MNRNAGSASCRVFLFLQGPSSSLFGKIASHLEERGHRCLRINLNAGDWLFWRRRGATNYRGTSTNWPAYIDDFMASQGVTDLVLLGEERPYHKVAVDKAKQRNVDVMVIEMGYLRPDWVTIERDGMSSNSRFPDDPRIIRTAAHGLPPVSMQQIYRQNFLTEALLDLAYNLPNVFLAAAFPGYRRHGLFHPLHEYGGWIIRLVKSRRRTAEAVATVDKIIGAGRPYYIYPLQLETDYQLRSHSPYHSQMDAIEEIVTSFALKASAATDLVIKLHPLDNGLLDWGGKIFTLADALGVKERVHFIDGGDLSVLIDHCAGMVTVNSTAVLGGLQKGVAVKSLGCAIYDLKGLTHQGPLDSFWSTPQTPDGDLAEDFFRLLAASTHVRGNFYSQTGSNAAAQAIAERLVVDNEIWGRADCGSAPRQRPLKRGRSATVPAW